MSDGPRYGQMDAEYATRLATTPPDEDGPVWMINLMSYRSKADYADGRSSDISGREADDLYAPFEQLAAVGAEIVFVAEVQDQLLGDQPKWDRVAIVKYPTRRSFIEMSMRPDFQEKHVHKEAGMAATIVMGGQPFITPPLDPVSWDDVPHPPNDEDGYVVVTHIIRFEGDPLSHETPEHMQEYQSVAARSAVANGVRIPAWFAVEGTIIGDGRAWHQARFNTFPSKRAFMAVVTDPDRLEAQREHREVAMADTYTMILRPVIDRLAESVRSS